MLKEGIFLGKRYEILDRIGSGGMADVYKGKDHKLNRYVAIKVLKSDFRSDETFIKKFLSEAQAAAGLMHPNVVNVYDVGQDRGVYYMVMELVEGITLKEYIEKKGRLSAKETISISIQMVTGIQAAHNQHIIHRDIKPQNIIISKDGKVKVTDFGIAGNQLLVFADDTIHYYNAKTGDPLPEETVFTEHLQMESGENTEEVVSSRVFTGMGEQGILYVSKKGIYVYNLGGSVVEQLLSEGYLTGISSKTELMDVETDADGNIYLAVSDRYSDNPTGMLLKYGYDKEQEAVPGTELDIYMLKRDTHMEQMISLFQKEYPDISVTVQEGMTGEDGGTATDAMKNLNTEIMSGEGPDVLLMDNLDAEN